MYVVIDTNVLVSALWSKDGTSAKILSMILNGKIIPCYDYRILLEYRNVLLRPKFGFSIEEVTSLLEWFEFEGRSVVVPSIDVLFSDEDDKKFYEVAKFCDAKLITGNLKHFPKDKNVISVSDFLKDIE